MKNNIFAYILLFLLVFSSCITIQKETSKDDNTKFNQKIKKAKADPIVYIFTMDSQEEIDGFSNDSTGAALLLNSEIVKQGTGSLEVSPGGFSEETKIAIDLIGDKIDLWNQNDEISMNIYIPKENKLKPTMFFMGIADTTEGYVWLDGGMSSTPQKTGWNAFRFVLNEKMTKLDPTRKYRIYLAFAGFEDNSKVPLKEKFYIDAIYSKKISDHALRLLIDSKPQSIKNEIETLLILSDDELLDAISKKTFDYFWNDVNSKNGLIRDRTTNNGLCSIASVGYGLAAIPIGIERGWITKEKGYERTLTTLKTFAEGKVEGKEGFFYHFVHMLSGKRVGTSEVSSIDTAILIAGALFAGQYFKGTEAEAIADQLYRNINWKWMMNDDEYLIMGWKPEDGFLEATWNAFTEGILATLLAIGSPTYPIPSETWNLIYRTISDDHISLVQEVLFIYQYPLNWLDLRDKEDKFANYFNNAINATKYNRDFVIANKSRFKGYDENIWGLSASDGPGGYRAYGAADENHDGTITPNAPIGSMPLTPQLSIKAIRSMLYKYGPLIWGKYGFISAFNIKRQWFSNDYIGIDQGNILLMIENYRSGMIWKHFMEIEYIQDAMQKIGFIDKKSEYAINPQYIEEYKKRIEQDKEAKKLSAKKVITPIKIDGDLGEWSEVKGHLVSEDMNVVVPGMKKVNKNKQVLHSTFYVQWDEKNLYLAADIADSEVISNILPNDKRSYYRTDSIEFYIDAMRNGLDGEIIKLAIIPFDTTGKVQAIRHEDFDPGPIEDNNPNIKVASKKTDQGYSIEVLIPFDDLFIKPKQGLVMGLSHTIHNTININATVGEYSRSNIISWNNIPEIWALSESWADLTLE